LPITEASCWMILGISSILRNVILMSVRLLRNRRKAELRAGHVISFVRIGQQDAVKQAKRAKCMARWNLANRRDFGGMLISALCSMRKLERMLLDGKSARDRGDGFRDVTELGAARTDRAFLACWLRWWQSLSCVRLIAFAVEEKKDFGIRTGGLKRMNVWPDWCRRKISKFNAVPWNRRRRSIWIKKIMYIDQKKQKFLQIHGLPEAESKSMIISPCPLLMMILAM
jgi:hypothetical protein